MRRSTDTWIAVQFLAVLVPIAFVLVAQMIADQHRVAALDYSRPLRNLADEARADYRTFTNGAADAVDTGNLSRQSAEALRASAVVLHTLAARRESAVLGGTPDLVGKLAAQIHGGTTLEELLPLRDQIAAAD